MKRKARPTMTSIACAVFVSSTCLRVGVVLGETYYVSIEGNDGSAGTSPKQAWRTISHAANMARAGDLVRIRGGDYGWEKVLIAGSGTPEAPVRFEAYDGDVRLDGLTRELRAELEEKWKAEGQELSKRGVSLDLKGHGVEIAGSHVKLRGFTVSGYGMGILVRGQHNTIELCAAALCSWNAIMLAGSDNEARYCTAYNSGMNNFACGGQDNTVADSWSYCDPRLIGIIPGVDTGTDYLYSASNAKRIRFVRCRGDGRLHAGHGISFTVGGSGPEAAGCEDCLVTDCEMYNCWELFAVRHKGHKIVFQNCYGESRLLDTMEVNDWPKWRQPSANWYSHGFYLYTGAHDILVKNCRVRGTRVGLDADDEGQRWKEWGVTRNITFENCIATDCVFGIQLNAPDSKAINCLSALNRYGARGFEKGTILRNCILYQNGTAFDGDVFKAAISRCNIWANETMLRGKGTIGGDCIFVDPQFAGRIDYDDWRLKETSPCKNMGPYADDPKASIGMR
ncbi:MAG: hypothetical protein FJ026_06865 [Chloroflexi bacterium]|nr:hypothetical protein [Chloroflexota bacterium]